MTYYRCSTCGSQKPADGEMKVTRTCCRQPMLITGEMEASQLEPTMLDTDAAGSVALEVATKTS